MTKNTVRHVLLELERAGWDSLCNQTGSEYYGELMLPNALMVLANGIAMDRRWSEARVVSADGDLRLNCSTRLDKRIAKWLCRRYLLNQFPSQ